MKRNEGELKYDYCARRLLEQYRTAIVKLGRAGWVSCQVIAEKNVETREVRVRKEPVDGTYRRSMKNERKMTKQEKKVAKKKRTKLKVTLQEQEYLRGCCGTDDVMPIVSP